MRPVSFAGAASRFGMNEYTDAIYRGGQHGFLAFGLEGAGMIAPHTSVLPASPAVLKFGGYTGVPGFQMPEGTQPVRAAGSPRPLKFIPGLRAPVIDDTLVLGSGANVMELLRGALRSDPTIPNVNRHMCLPVFAVSGGAVDSCESFRAFHWQGRCAQINTLGMTISQGQPVSCNVQFWPVCIDKNKSALTAPTDALIQAAGGEVYAWQHLEFQFGGSDMTDILGNISLSISNGLSRGPMRTLNSVGGDKTNPLYRCCRQIKVGNEDISLNLALEDKLPASMDGEEDIGVLKMVLSNEAKVITIQIESNFVAGQTQNQTGAEAPMAFGAQIMSSQISISSANA
jgi:hypothetical protein